MDIHVHDRVLFWFVSECQLIGVRFGFAGLRCAGTDRA